MKIFGLLLVSLFPMTLHGAIEAGPLINPANGHRYYLLTSDTWTHSEAEAVTLGGHLVTINDAAENQWVVDTFANFGGVIRPLWIGLTDRDEEGTFKWISGQDFSYANWNVASGEPNNSGGSGYEEDFVYIIQDHPGNPTVFPTFWNDVPDDGFGVIPPIHGVVEVEDALPPTPYIIGRKLCWETVAGVAYQAQWKAATSRGKWVNYGRPVIGSGGEVCIASAPRPDRKRLYRVIILDGSRSMNEMVFAAESYFLDGARSSLLRSLSDSPLALTVLVTNGVPQITLRASNKRSYRLEYANELSPTTAWHPVATLLTSNGMATFIDSNAVSYATRFYRTVVNEFY
jgi:hypothetical protein